MRAATHPLWTHPHAHARTHARTPLPPHPLPHTQSRPFGVALLIAGWDLEAGPVLYHTDPSGTYVKYRCMAIGSGSEGALTALQVRARRGRGGAAGVACAGEQRGRAGGWPCPAIAHVARCALAAASAPH